MFFVERETLCDSSVTYKTFYFCAVNGWEGQSDAVVGLEDTLFMTLFDV